MTSRVCDAILAVEVVALASLSSAYPFAYPSRVAHPVSWTPGPLRGRPADPRRTEIESEPRAATGSIVQVPPHAASLSASRRAWAGVRYPRRSTIHSAL